MQYAPAALTLGLGLCGVKGQHAFKDRAIIMMMSYATMAAVVNVAKYTFKEKRPDSSSRNSFPSGHTATAFVGAEMLYQEYRTSRVRSYCLLVDNGVSDAEKRVALIVKTVC